jgi:hypothetical protein
MWHVHEFEYSHSVQIGRMAALRQAQASADIMPDKGDAHMSSQVKTTLEITC